MDDLTFFTEDLTSKKRHNEAARVLLDYAKHVRQAVIALVQGNDFSEARRIVRVSVSISIRFTEVTAPKVTLLAEPELTKEIIYPGALESRAQIADDINETREQLRKQLNRIKELRIKKVEEPGSYHHPSYTLSCLSTLLCSQMHFMATRIQICTMSM